MYKWSHAYYYCLLFDIFMDKTRIYTHEHLDKLLRGENKNNTRHIQKCMYAKHILCNPPSFLLATPTKRLICGVGFLFSLCLFPGTPFCSIHPTREKREKKRVL